MFIILDSILPQQIPLSSLLGNVIIHFARKHCVCLNCNICLNYLLKLLTVAKYGLVNEHFYFYALRV